VILVLFLTSRMYRMGKGGKGKKDDQMVNWGEIRKKGK
jgi:hypothetical protein